MRASWAWRVMMLVAVPSLALVAMAVFTQLPYALENPEHQDRDGLIAWAVAVGVGVLALLASFIARRAGATSIAIVLAAVVALPALAGIGFFLLVVGLFILKGS